MEYVGNFKEWVVDDFIDVILKSEGDRRPKDDIKVRESEIYNKWITAGYDFKKIKWTLYYQTHFENRIELPPFFKNVKTWWISRLDPGDIFPFHQDLFEDDISIDRFSMMLTDYQPGHVFMYGNRCISNYRAGDVFKFTNSKEWHGACNIGFVPKITLQISTLNNNFL